ncbi:hypothetical protein C2845_PM08G13830 [Panicum miliaceum]|uniref:Uncharacterized protein n=1 Tax=Panicum miliaceum TaxID=4540 RepID=A0A3L6R487_PANMI|nr:hypothetical protein C2845_PM08G13830 [Panicum miliaceum]
MRVGWLVAVACMAVLAKPLILKDESTREQYDYAIAHPEEVFYNTAQYYRAYYGHKTDPRAVLIGLLLIVSAFQYINQLTRYNQAIESVKQTPAYRNRLKALEFERTGGIASKKKGHKQMDKKFEEAVSNEVELQIHGVEKPSVWRLYDESRKEDLVTRRLWEKSNMERYIAETRKESKRRR